MWLSGGWSTVTLKVTSCCYLSRALKCEPQVHKLRITLCQFIEAVHGHTVHRNWYKPDWQLADGQRQMEEREAERKDGREGEREEQGREQRKERRKGINYQADLQSL